MKHIISTADISFTKQLEIKNIGTLQKNKPIYFIPAIVYDALIKQLKANNLLCSSYLTKCLEVITKIIYHAYHPDLQLSAKQLKRISNDYNKIISRVEDELIASKSAYKVGEYCRHYYVHQYTDWLCISIGSEKESDQLSLMNELSVNHSCQNDLFLNTLSEAEIHIPTVITEEYDTLFNPLNKKYKQSITDTKRKELFTKRLLQLFLFNKYRFIKKGNKVNRVFSSFTSLTSIARKYVTYKNAYFIELDIKNCQPLFLALFLLKNNLPIDEAYLKLVSQGTFYESIQAKARDLNIDHETIITSKSKGSGLTAEDFFFADRNDTKVLTYRSVFFNTKTKSSHTAHIFSELYPLTYQSIVDYSEQTDSNLAEALQNAEAELILKIIPKCPYFTVHDAMYVTDLNEAIRIQQVIIDKVKEISNDRLDVIIAINTPNQTNRNSITNQETDNNDSSIMILPQKNMRTKKKMAVDTFRKLYGTITKKEIISQLSISERTYKNYKKELSKTIA